MDLNSLVANTNYDKRFFGIYRGIIADTDDPANKNRIKVIVPQVTGDNITNWAWPAGILNPDVNYTPHNIYGSFYSTATTSVNVVGAAATIAPLSSTEVSNTFLSLDAGNSNVSVNTDGAYEITSALQLVCSSGSSDIDVSIWVEINAGAGFVALDGSRHVVTLKGAGHNVIDVHTEIVELSAGSSVRIALISSGPNIRFEYLSAASSPTRPTGWSSNLMIKGLGTQTPYYPPKGSGVWVMYEGGDPNFPVWMGVF